MQYSNLEFGPRDQQTYFTPLMLQKNAPMEQNMLQILNEVLNSLPSF